ncbi:hypothetical protein MPSEU_000298900 [Mayamaea pseudoterrestris]|nr:hypothetical protein MPSEU_000298900 [Mayamaea pseudoterrestris]
MAAHEEPALNIHEWPEEQQSSDHSVGSRSLENGMMGMSLTNEGRQNSSGPSGSTAAASLSASPPAELLQHTKPYRGSDPSSPDTDNGKAGIGRGPGGFGPHPSPIGKAQGHSSKNTAATSPLMSLTPNSSVDGNTDWQSLGGGVPALPFLQGAHRRGSDNGGFGSFDLAGNDNDGLHGLGALRDRSYSSPGPLPVLSSSPPVIGGPRGHVAAHASEGVYQGRPASNPRDRPPLSQSYQEGASAHGDRSLGFSSNRSTGSDASFESNYGAVGGRSGTAQEFRPASNDFGMNRRRASSGDNFYNPYAASDSMGFSQKFGSLPTLGSHMQQQRMGGYANGGEQLERPRHIRSVSQPMPAGQIPPRMDQRYYQQNLSNEGHSYSGGDFRSKSQQASQSYPSLAASYEGYPNQRRGSAPNLNQSISHGQLHNVRGNDYYGSPHSHSQGSIIALAEDMRAFPSPSMISPGHSPVPMYYSAHSRQSSDGGSTMLSSSPMSMGGVPRSGVGKVPRQHFHGDEELSHPLIGEHIDVPDYDDYQSDMFGNTQHAGSHYPSHGHSMSLEQLPSYSDMHFGSTGSILPMPKVVFAVKFKRTQRNFVLGPRINRDLKIGTYVKVEADRGEDLGIVVGKVSADKYNHSGGRGGFGPPSAGMGSGAADLKRINRLATHDEVSLLSLKREEEDELLRICRAKVRQRGLPMHVIDAEYQFDRHKLTFFFEAEGRVDFRELVRDLFSMYKTRIWMQQIDKSTASSAMAMMAPTASAVQMDYGIPIIAPASEFADSIVLGGFGDGRSH